MKRFKTIWSISVFVTTALFVVAGANAQSGSESTVQGFEANEVFLTLDSGNRILEVRVKGCELCEKQSYLPVRDIVITKGDQKVAQGDYQRVSGNSGTIMFDEKNGMVFEVNYWLSREEGEVR